MRLLLQRSREGTGADTRYVLACRLEVRSDERPLLDMVPGAHWLHVLVDLGIDRDKLMGEGCRLVFVDVMEAEGHQARLRDAFKNMRTYLDVAHAYGGERAVEVDLSDLR